MIVNCNSSVTGKFNGLQTHEKELLCLGVDECVGALVREFNKEGNLPIYLGFVIKIYCHLDASLQ